MSTVKSSTTSHTESQSAVRRLSTLALAGLLFFLLTVIVGQFMRPDLSPARDFLSAYALGSFRLIMTAGFVAVGVSILLLTVGLWRFGLVNRSGQIGAWILGVAGVAMLGIAVFPAEIDVPDPSIIGQLHDLSALVHFLAMTIGALLVSLSFRHAAQWSRYARSEAVLAVAIVVAFLLFFTVYPLQAGTEPSVPGLRPVIGIYQRALIFFVWLWLTVTSVRLRHLAGGASA